VLEDLWRRHRVIEGRTADKDYQQKPQDLDADVAFAARDFLAPIIAALAALFGRLHRLTINARGTGSGLLRKLGLVARAGLTKGEAAELLAAVLGDWD
jgi:hypothetical protein